MDFLQDVIDGMLVVDTPSSIAHQGVRLTATGTIMLQVVHVFPPSRRPGHKYFLLKDVKWSKGIVNS